jgi:hypothetical protein
MTNVKRWTVAVALAAAASIASGGGTQQETADGAPPAAAAAYRVAEATRQRAIHEELALGRLEALAETMAPYADVGVAVLAGYALFVPCASDGRVDSAVSAVGESASLAAPVQAAEPRVLIYGVQADGRLQLHGVEYSVTQRAWHDDGYSGPPMLFEQRFRLDDSAVDEPVYRLRVWIGIDHPDGVFGDAFPAVECLLAERLRSVAARRP